MALTDGDPILPQSVSITLTGSPVLQGGDIVFGASSALGSGCCNNGADFSVTGAYLREVAPGDAANFGRQVQLADQGPEKRGVVIAAFQAELLTTGGTGGLTQCVLVQGQGVRYLARAADVEFLD